MLANQYTDMIHVKFMTCLISFNSKEFLQKCAHITVLQFYIILSQFDSIISAHRREHTEVGAQVKIVFPSLTAYI